MQGKVELIKSDGTKISIDLISLFSIKLGEIESRCQELNKDTEYQIICYSGSRSGMACRFLGQKGYKVTNVMGGMSSYGGELSYGR